MDDTLLAPGKLSKQYQATNQRTLPSPHTGFADFPSAPGLRPNHNSDAVTFWPSLTV